MIIITVILSLFIISFWFLGYFYMQSDTEIKRTQREINGQKKRLTLKIDALQKQQAVLENEIQELENKIQTIRGQK